jgi:hypothetical protein
MEKWMNAAGENAIPMNSILAPRYASHSSDGGGPASLSTISPKDHMKKAKNRKKAGMFPGLLRPDLIIRTSISAPKVLAMNAGQKALGNHMIPQLQSIT